ncbi:MAG: pentapeptide repeat-containing protein [Bacteroidota bacterium]
MRSWRRNAKNLSYSRVKTLIKKSAVPIGIFLVLLSGLTKLIWDFYRYENQQLSLQRELIDLQKEEIEAVRKGAWLSYMNQLLDKLEEETANHPERKLSKQSITKIALLSQSLEPETYHYVEGDSLKETDYSLERGHLLQRLILLNMHAESFQEIKKRTSFAKADLKNAQLASQDLSGINLVSAQLKGANLSKTNLQEANLRGANLWGAELVEADLSWASMNRANLAWANVEGASLVETVMEGTDLQAAKFIKSNMHCTLIRYAKVQGTIFDGADLSGAIVFGNDLTRASLRGTNLSGAHFGSAILVQTDLEGADFREAILRDVKINDEKWFSKLEGWKVKGLAKIKETYELRDDKSKTARFYLKKLDD